MSLKIVVNWIAELAMRYALYDILRILSRAFPNIVPSELDFPNNHYLVTLTIIDQLITLRKRQIWKNDSIDKKIQTCEFWRRLRNLILNVMTDTKLSSNLPKLKTFVAQINVVEYEIHSRIRHSMEVDQRVDEMLDCSTTELDEIYSEIEYIKYVSVLKIRKDSIRDINTKIKELLEDTIIDYLKAQIEETILG